VLEFGGNWEDLLPLVEFTYNNSYQASIGMAPYEALYGRKCRTPICWDEIKEWHLLVRLKRLSFSHPIFSSHCTSLSKIWHKKEPV